MVRPAAPVGRDPPRAHGRCRCGSKIGSDVGLLLGGCLRTGSRCKQSVGTVVENLQASLSAFLPGALPPSPRPLGPGAPAIDHAGVCWTSYDAFPTDLVFDKSFSGVIKAGNRYELDACSPDVHSRLTGSSAVVLPWHRGYRSKPGLRPLVLGVAVMTLMRAQAPLRWVIHSSKPGGNSIYPPCYARLHSWRIMLLLGFSALVATQ